MDNKIVSSNNGVKHSLIWATALVLISITTVSLYVYSHINANNNERLIEIRKIEKK
jgi:hypothetical protein